MDYQILKKRTVNSNQYLLACEEGTALPCVGEGCAGAIGRSVHFWKVRKHDLFQEIETPVQSKSEWMFCGNLFN